jgi:sugar phosphate isomerase/epimerase
MTEAGSTRFRLIGNNGFTTEDYPQPEIWASVLRDMGLAEFEYFADHMEPVLFRSVVTERSEFFQATVKAIGEYGLEVWSAATARVSYLMNLLSHPYADMRSEGLEWCKAYVDLALALGAKFISGHYDCISKPEVAGDLEAARSRAIDGMVAMGEYGAEAGLEAIFLENMHRAQLLPYTIDGALRMLEELNRRSPIPFHMHVDTGHMAFIRDDPAHTERDRGVMEWLAQPYPPNRWLLIHAQQADVLASRHWPFTADYNPRGIVDAREAIHGVERSGVERCAVALEILFPRSTLIEEIRPQMIESAEYWRNAFADCGYKLEGKEYVKDES